MIKLYKIEQDIIILETNWVGLTHIMGKVVERGLGTYNAEQKMDQMDR